MHGTYILEGHTPVLCEDTEKWSKAFSGDRSVAHTRKGDVEVSTVFLGVDHNHSGQGDPILFESMVFGGKYDQACQRYRTWDEAVAGHNEMVERYLDSEADDDDGTGNEAATGDQESSDQPGEETEAKEEAGGKRPRFGL